MHNREMVPKWIKNLASSLFVSFVYHLHICKFLMSPPMSKMSPPDSPPCICCPPPEMTILNPPPLSRPMWKTLHPTIAVVPISPPVDFVLTKNYPANMKNI